MVVVVLLVAAGEGVVVVVMGAGEGVDIVVIAVVAGDGTVVIVMLVGEGVVIVITVFPSFSLVSLLLLPSLACLVAGVSCPEELLLADGVLTISVNRKQAKGVRKYYCHKHLGRMCMERARNAHVPYFSRVCDLFTY